MPCEHSVSSTVKLCSYIYSTLGSPKVFGNTDLFLEQRALHFQPLISPCAALHVASNINHGVVRVSMLLLGLSSKSASFVRWTFGLPAELSSIQEDDSLSPNNVISVLCRWWGVSYTEHF